MFDELVTITPRQLRGLLFFLPDELTVKELRNQLFDSPNMDEEFMVGWVLLERMMAAKDDTDEESGQ